MAQRSAHAQGYARYFVCGESCGKRQAEKNQCRKLQQSGAAAG